MCVCVVLRGRWSWGSTFGRQLETLATPRRELPNTKIAIPKPTSKTKNHKTCPWQRALLTMPWGSLDVKQFVFDAKRGGPVLLYYIYIQIYTIRYVVNLLEALPGRALVGSDALCRKLRKRRQYMLPLTSAVTSKQDASVASNPWNLLFSHSRGHESNGEHVRSKVPSDHQTLKASCQFGTLKDGLSTSSAANIT